MGEATKLTAEESRTFVRQVLARVNGSVPVVVGASAPGFAPMGELTRAVMDLGASGVMVAPPSTVRTDDQIVAYFDMVSETLGPDVPWVLQDHPVSTGVQMSAGVILRILKNAPTCVMLKHEDWPGLAKLSAIRAASDKGELQRVSILTGNGGGLFLPEELTRGADGAMTGFAYPEMMVDVVAAHARGDRARAHDLFDAYLPLARYEQQAGVGLAVRKHLFKERGVIASAMVRKPGPKLSPQDVEDIRFLVQRQDKRLRELGPA
ncbi:MAG TPA: dihydrodipicolinate synthase family protein, partial [Ramlibacter sp.]|nr:dihydrodipicolinate synthase family protein [Ramlibacter sp.]